MVKEHYIYILAGIVLCQRLCELHVARKNRLWMMAAGAKEFGAGHYPLFFMLHSLWFIGWTSEGQVTGQLSPWWPYWLSILLLAQGLRYWCMLALGRAWNTRILVLPGNKAVKKGPYRFLPHPNYLAVGIELLCIPLLFEAFYTAAAFTLLNGWLLLNKRIPAENRALKLLH